MKIFLYTVASIMLLGPVAAWTYIVALGCAYKTNAPNCGVRPEDYWDAEFLTLAALPWLIGVVCLIAASAETLNAEVSVFQVGALNPDLEPAPFGLFRYILCRKQTVPERAL